MEHLDACLIPLAGLAFVLLFCGGLVAIGVGIGTVIAEVEDKIDG